KCYVNASGSVRSVAFTMDSTSVGTDSAPADGMQCALDTTKFANGTHQLKAVVTGADGSTRTDIISVNVQNTSTPTPTPMSGSLGVWFKAPLNGSTISGVLAGGTKCYVNASGSVRSVAFT